MPIRKHIGIHQNGGKVGKLQKGYKYTGEKTKTGLSVIKKIKQKKTNKKIKQIGGTVQLLQERLYPTISRIVRKAIVNTNKFLSDNRDKNIIIEALILCSGKEYFPSRAETINNMIKDIRRDSFRNPFNQYFFEKSNKFNLVNYGDACLLFYCGTKAMSKFISLKNSTNFLYKLHLNISDSDSDSHMEFARLYINSLLVFYLNGYDDLVFLDGPDWLSMKTRTIKSKDQSHIEHYMLESNLRSLGLTSVIDDKINFKDEMNKNYQFNKWKLYDHISNQFYLRPEMGDFEGTTIALKVAVLPKGMGSPQSFIPINILKLQTSTEKIEYQMAGNLNFAYLYYVLNNIVSKAETNKKELNQLKFLSQMLKNGNINCILSKNKEQISNFDKIRKTLFRRIFDKNAREKKPYTIPIILKDIPEKIKDSYTNCHETLGKIKEDMKMFLLPWLVFNSKPHVSKILGSDNYINPGIYKISLNYIPGSLWENLTIENFKYKNKDNFKEHQENVNNYKNMSEVLRMGRYQWKKIPAILSSRGSFLADRALYANILNSWATKMYEWAMLQNPESLHYLDRYTYGVSRSLNTYLLISTITGTFKDEEAQNDAEILPTYEGNPTYRQVLEGHLKFYSNSLNLDRNEFFKDAVFPKNGMWLFRSVKLLNLKDGTTPWNLQKNQILKQYAMISCSTNFHMVLKKYYKGQQDNCIYKIKIKKQSRVLYLFNSMNDKLSKKKEEEEVLLPYGCDLRVISTNYEYYDTGFTTKVLIITCELIDSPVLENKKMNIKEKTDRIINDAINFSNKTNSKTNSCVDMNSINHMNLISDIGIGNRFVDLLPKEEEKEYNYLGTKKIDNQDYANYAEKAFNDFKGYKNNLNNIKVTPFNKSNNTNENVKYIKNFCKQIFNNISTKSYPNENYDIPRRNHGGLNHLRSLKFGVLVIELLITSPSINPQIKRELFKTKSFQVMLILSTMFESIMRVDEEGSGQVLCNISLKYFKKLYPTLKRKTYNTSQSPHQIASSILHLVLMKKCFSSNIDNETIETLSKAVSYHFQNKNNLNININKLQILDILNKTKNLNFFIYNAIIISGHYLDHCRMGMAAPSKMIEKDNIKSLFKLFNVPEFKKKMLITKVIKTVAKTEYSSEDYWNTYFLNPKQDKHIVDLKPTEIHKDLSRIVSYPNSKINTMSKACEILDGKYPRKGKYRQGRYPKEGTYRQKYIQRSTNFETAWKDLELEADIRNLLDIFEPKEEDKKDNDKYNEEPSRRWENLRKPEEQKKQIRLNQDLENNEEFNKELKDLENMMNNGGKTKKTQSRNRRQNRRLVRRKNIGGSLTLIRNSSVETPQISSKGIDLFKKVSKIRNSSVEIPQISSKGIDLFKKVSNNKSKYSVRDIHNIFLINLWEKYPKVCNIINISEEMLIKSLTNEKNKESSLKNISLKKGGLKKKVKKGGLKKKVKKDDIKKKVKKGGLKKKIKKDDIKKKVKKDDIKKKVKKGGLKKKIKKEKKTKK